MAENIDMLKNSDWDNYMYFYLNGHKPISFFREDMLCSCDICRRTDLKWFHLEPYADSGIKFWFGMTVDTDLSNTDVEKMIKVAVEQDKYASYRYPRDVSIAESCNFHLGLFSNDYLKNLPEDLQQLCMEYRDDMALISDYAIAGFIMDAHSGFRLGSIEKESYVARDGIDHIASLLGELHL